MQDREKLALIAVERTRMPMLVTDPGQPDNPIILANQAFLDLSGYVADEVVGRNCRFLRDPDLLSTSGDALIGAELGLKYPIPDLDGKQPPSHRKTMGAPLLAERNRAD